MNSEKIRTHLLIASRLFEGFEMALIFVVGVDSLSATPPDSEY